LRLPRNVCQCGKVCKNKAAKHKHEIKAHKDGWTCEYEAVDEEGQKYWCKKVLLNRKSFIKHKRVHVSEPSKKYPYVCAVANCTWGTQEKEMFANHMAKKHPEVHYVPGPGVKQAKCDLTNKAGEVCGVVVMSVRYLEKFHKGSTKCKGREED
jgi:DNA-directed RNA polymerase subunit N (RpoN/RPB10)